MAAVAPAVVIGQRMSTDAMAVAVGVVLGVAASIPTSLLVVAATRGRRDESYHLRRDELRPPPPAPQIYGELGVAAGTRCRPVAGRWNAGSVARCGLAAMDCTPPASRCAASRLLARMTAGWKTRRPA
ncbi:MAG: hypothetical protein M9927_12695 [Anaerolineae bacterium]|nr:hypothetical protein [Anaerolineae bacterium]